MADPSLPFSQFSTLAAKPVITRDEFKRTRYRKRMFEYLIDLCEQKLEKALGRANKEQSDNKLVVLEDILTNVLSTVSREDNRRRVVGPNQAVDRAMLDSLEPPEGGLDLGTGSENQQQEEDPKTVERRKEKEAKAVPRRKKQPQVHRLQRRLIRGGQRNELIGNTIT